MSRQLFDASRRPTWGLSLVEGIGAAALAVSLVAVSGPIGLVVTAMSVVAWLLAPVPYAIVVGHIGLVTIGPAELGPVPVLVVEIGFASILLAALVSEANGRVAIGAAVATLVVTGATSAMSLVILPPWGAAVAILLTLAVIGYAVHRFELVRFELIDDGAAADSDRGAVAAGTVDCDDHPEAAESSGEINE